MPFVVGRHDPDTDERDEKRPETGHLGTFRAVDGSAGASLEIDLDGPHAVLVVGKRGYGKSYTLGVLAEELARARGVAPVLVDPMGVFDTLESNENESQIPATVIETPTISAGTLDPQSWCSLLGLSPESAAGSLVWQVTETVGRENGNATIAEMKAALESTEAKMTAKRAARNHLNLAASWDVFDKGGLDGPALATDEVTVLDLSGFDAPAMNAVLRGVGEALFRARLDDSIERLPWLLVDEVHAFFEGIASKPLETILTRGRAPGVSLVMATQRPGVVPEVAISQSDILMSHRLTAGEDIEALRSAQPTYLSTSLTERMPTQPGDVVLVDDTTETVHAGTIRERITPHGGESPSARDFAASRRNQVSRGYQKR